MSTLSQKDTYTVEEAAIRLGVSRGVAYQQVRNGTIPSQRLGKRLLIPKSRFHAWLDGEVAA